MTATAAARPADPPPTVAAANGTTAGAPRRRAHGATVLVMAVGLAVTAILAVAAWAARNGNEDRLLDQRAREAASILQAAIPRVQTPLAAAAEVAEATNGDRQALTQLMEPLVGPGNPFVSASIWPATGAEPIVVIGQPTTLATLPPAEVDAFISRSLATPLLGVLLMLDRPEPRLGYSFTSRRTPSRYIAYAEGALPRDRLSVAQSDSAFADLEYALYVGSSADPERLTIASTRELPFSGRRASATVPFGDTSLHLVIAPRGQLGGGLMAVLPWLIAATGVLVTVGAALLTERILRGRNHAEALVAELERVAQENADLYAEQRTVAQTLQHSLLPQELPAVPGVEIGVRYESGVDRLDIGGDWYDVIETGDGRLVFVVGDVSGRGLAAATIMAALRHSIRAYAMQGDEPATILAKLAALVSVGRDGHFATILCGAVDRGRREVSLVNAGHPSPLIVDGQGARFVPTDVGVPVGTVDHPVYVPVSVVVPPDGVLLAFTDGLFERRGETVDVGLERLRQVAADGDRSLDALLTKVLDSLSAGRGSDDTAILGLRWQS